ncbi:hypothetical protein JQ543_11305 [Bradyrhizobium diazoefficiens]|nr:hypothetical protein [Bradyrhizobium diazoefficiens]MBR0848327.1 hypothetical protein [Bradyrhizobium diazoefficiens]
MRQAFRSTFKDWCTEQTGSTNEKSQVALAQTVPDKVEAAYRRGNMLEKGRQMLADWAAYCVARARRRRKATTWCRLEPEETCVEANGDLLLVPADTFMQRRACGETRQLYVLIRMSRPDILVNLQRESG